MLLVVEIDAARWGNSVESAGFTDRCCCVQSLMLPEVETDAAGCSDRCCCCGDRCCWVQRQMEGKMLLCLEIDAAECRDRCKEICCWL